VRECSFRWSGGGRRCGFTVPICSRWRGAAGKDDAPEVFSLAARPTGDEQLEAAKKKLKARWRRRGRFEYAGVAVAAVASSRRGRVLLGRGRQGESVGI